MKGRILERLESVETDTDTGIGGHRAETIRPEKGYGFDAILVLQTARTLAGDPRFCGSSIEALREAGKQKDIEISRAVLLLKCVRPPERIAKRIVSVPDHDRESFRRRMLTDFDGAIARLMDAAKPTHRRTTAVRAARDAQNWAGSSAAEKDANWERMLADAMADHDRDGRARGISGAEVFVPAPRPGGS